jgi:hypothetical protein
MPGTSRPTPPTASLSICPNGEDADHDRIGPAPVTPRQPDSWMLTGGKPCAPSANTSRTDSPDAAVQDWPDGMSGSAQRAVARARTWVAPLTVTWREEEVRLTSTRSTPWSSAQSDPTAGVPAAAAEAADELALAGDEVPDGLALAGAEVACSALPVVALPHAVSPTRALTAIRPRTPRAAMAGLPSPPLDGPRPAAVPSREVRLGATDQAIGRDISK